MPLEISIELISGYAKETYRHSAYEKTVEKYEALKVHANGEVPERLIFERRPSESEYIMAYRKKIYVPITKSDITRVISSLSKIRRSTDWSILFPEDAPALIADDETLEKYTGYNFPYGFKSITNWLFGVALKNYLIDANAVVLVIPINLDADAASYYKPFPFIFNSPRVLDYVADDYAVLLSEKTCNYKEYNQNGSVYGEYSDGMIIHYVDTTTIKTYHQSNKGKTKWELVRDFPHNLGVLPAFKMPGVFFEACEDSFVNESRISGMVPHMDEAARIYSDLQAEVVQHVHSEKWLYMNTSCTTCNGLGYEFINDNRCECEKCKGLGKVPTSPYSNHVVMPPEMGQESVPTPPAGYIQKTDVAEMTDKMDGMVDRHLYKALASINMQFLDQSPLNQSGVAKEVDKDELNNFVHSVAEDLVKILDEVIKLINDYRYRVNVSDAKARNELLPQIAVPERFDLLSSNFLMDEINSAKENNINTLIISALETEFAAKKFYNKPEIAKELVLIFKLDPMPYITDEDKMVRLTNQGVTLEDYVISCNLVPFVRRALVEIDDFFAWSLAEQQAKIKEYAAEKMAINSPSAQISAALSSDGPSPADLKFTVGGLTGMVEIAKAVASGLYDLDAAVTLVSDRFGLTPEEARKQLGTPQPITNDEQLNKITELT